MIWKLLIKKVSNGYVLRGRWNSDVVTEMVINDEQDDLEPEQELLYAVLEYFAVYHSKHNQKNIKVIIEEKVSEE